MTPLKAREPASVTDDEIVSRIRNGETALFEELVRRHNTRLYRAVRGIVKDDAEAEDVMQQAYLNAFTHLTQFAGRAAFATWLTRIAIHEALGRQRRLRPMEALPESVDDGVTPSAESSVLSPERQAYAGELRRLIEDMVVTLPDDYRAVFMLREIEGISTEETALWLELSEEAVKTRLHRARARLRRDLLARLGSDAGSAFTFLGTRCDGMVNRVFASLGSSA